MATRRTSRAVPATQAAQPAAQELPRKFLFTLVEAAELLSISRATLYREMGSGDIASIYVGGRRLIPYAVLAAYVRRLMHAQGLGEYAEAV